MSCDNCSAFVCSLAASGVVHCGLYVCQRSWTSCMMLASKRAVRMSTWVGDAHISMAAQTLLKWCTVRELLHISAALDSLLARRAVFSRFIDIVASVTCICRCTGGGSSSSVLRLILLVMPWLEFKVGNLNWRLRQNGRYECSCCSCCLASTAFLIGVR